MSDWLRQMANRVLGFIVNPRSAGELAALYLSNPGSLREAEVMDLDEEAYRSGVFAPMLCGYLGVPFAS